MYVYNIVNSSGKFCKILLFGLKTFYIAVVGSVTDEKELTPFYIVQLYFFLLIFVSVSLFLLHIYGFVFLIVI